MYIQAAKAFIFKFKNKNNNAVNNNLSLICKHIHLYVCMYVCMYYVSITYSNKKFNSHSQGIQSHL